jgi:hypothetical protein
MKKILLTTFLGMQLLVAHAQNIPADFTLKELSDYVNQNTDCQKLACSTVSKMSVESINWDKKELKLSFTTQSRILSSQILPVNITGLNIKNIQLDGKDWGSVTKSGSQLSIVSPEGIHKVDLILSFNSELLNIELFQKPKNFTGNIGAIINRGNTYFLSIINGEAKTTKIVKEENNINTVLPIKPMFIISHNLYLKHTWKLQTIISPVPGSIITQPVLVEVPIVEGEKILNSELKVENGKVLMTNAPVTWESVLPVQTHWNIKASSNGYLEQVNVYAEKEWLYDYKGVNPVGQSRLPQYKNGNQWQLWPNDNLNLHFFHPAALEGATNAVNNYNVSVIGSANPLAYNITFDYVTSLGGRTYVTIPKGYTLDNLSVNGKVASQGIENGKVALELLSGKNNVALTLKSPEELVGLISLPKLGFDTSVTNSSYTVLQLNKWVLLAGGANIHPAILIWGILITLSLFSIILAKTKITPYNTFAWILLLFGLSQSGLFACAVVIQTILLFGIKPYLVSKHYLEKSSYNAYQIVLGFFTLLSISVVLYTLNQGLLNSPEVFISGIESSADKLYWYAENNTASSPWAIILPVWVYRVCMFLWAMWFAAKSMDLIKWMWALLNNNGLWLKSSIVPNEDLKKTTEVSEIIQEDNK